MPLEFHETSEHGEHAWKQPGNNHSRTAAGATYAISVGKKVDVNYLQGEQRMNVRPHESGHHLFGLTKITAELQRVISSLVASSLGAPTQFDLRVARLPDGDRQNTGPSGHRAEKKVSQALSPRA